MFEKKELIGLDGNPYTKCFYEFNEEDTIVGIIYGHFSPFTGPNGHGRLIEALKKIGAEKFLIVTPQKSTYDADRDMYDINQRVAIAQKFLDEYGYEGKAIPWKIRRGGLKSQLGPILNEAVEAFGLNIRPVYCFGPDRAEVASEVCNEFGNIKMPNRVEYIVDMERGTSGTRVRELIRQNNIEEICNETGYSPKMAKYLVSLCKDKLEEAIRGKVELDFANIYDANEFKQEMEDRFEDDKSIHISSNFRLPTYKEGKDMDFEKIYRESAHLTEFQVDDDWEREKARARPRINKGYKDVVDIIESWGLEAFETHDTVEIRIPRGLDSENVVTEWEHLNDLDTMGEDRILNYSDLRAKMSQAAVDLAHKIYDTFDCENIDQVRVGRHKCYAIFLVNPRVR